MIRCVLLMASVFVAGCATSDPRSELTPGVFGAEQATLYGIRAGVALDEGRGVMTVRGREVLIEREDDVFRVDTNLDGELGDERALAADGSMQLVRVGEAPVLVRVDANGRGEYMVSETWRFGFEHAGESIDGAALWFGSGIVFIDSDGDGRYESYWDVQNPVALGGRFWRLSLDFESGVGTLSRSDKAPIAVGFVAPNLDADQLDSDQRMALIEAGKTTVLVFCHAGCAGCRGIAAPLAELASTSAGQDDRRLVSVSRSPEEAVGCREAVCPDFEHAVSAEAWAAYAVTPTPTILIIDGDGVIRYRGAGAGSETAAVLAEVLDRIGS